MMEYLPGLLTRAEHLAGPYVFPAEYPPGP